MAQRDYAARGGSKRKKKSGGVRSILLIVGILVVLGFAVGLYFLKNNSTVTAEVQHEKLASAKPKSQLPSRPEETWSYIKELESRTVPTDDSALANSAKLSDKQKEELKRLKEAEKQASLEKASKAEEAANVATNTTTSTSTSSPTVTNEVAQAEESKQIAEERKVAEQRRKVELAKIETAKKAESLRVSGGFGLQCGAFNNKAKAEALQAKLAMASLNARITESGKWNRVLVGPLGSRVDAVNAQKQASSITNCVVIGM